MSTSSDVPQADQDAPMLDAARGKKASYFFWGTIIVLALITIGLTLMASLRDGTRQGETPAQQTVEVERTKTEAIIGSAGQVAAQSTAEQVNALLDAVYRPVYAAIPAYADFHYSVYGEYTELGAAAIGQMGGVIERRLFNGFEQRLNEAGMKVDALFKEEYRNVLRNRLAEVVPEDSRHLPLGNLTTAAIEDAQRRFRYTAPIGTIAAVGVGSGAIKALSMAVAQKIAVKVGAKAALKGAAKGTGVVADAGGGALACSWSGPFAAVCGAAGGVGAWLLADTAIISLDEYFNRDEFETELRLMVSEDRARRRTQIQNALRAQGKVLDDKAKESFTLRDHAVERSAQPNK